MKNIIKTLTEYAEKFGISGKSFDGANVENNIAYIGNGHVCLSIKTEMPDGLYDNNLTKIEDAHNYIPAKLFNQVTPKNICYEIKTNNKELMTIFNQTQEKVKTENIKGFFESEEVIKSLGPQTIKQFQKSIKPIEYIKIEVVENVLYINEIPVKNAKVIVKDSSVDYFVTFFNVNILKTAIKYLTDITISLEATKSPILLSDNKFKIIAMCANNGKNAKVYRNGRAYEANDITLAKSMLFLDNDEAFYTKLDNAYQIKATSKIKNNAIDIYNSLKLQPIARNYKGFNVEDKFVYITNGVVAYKIKSELSDGFYSADDFNSKYNQKLVTVEMKNPINKQQLKNVTPEENKLAYKITVNRNRFLEALNNTQIKNKKHKGLKPTEYIEFKVENNNLYINDKLVLINNIKGYNQEFISTFDMSYLKTLKEFQETITIKFYEKNINTRFNGEQIILYSATYITDYESEMVLMPVSPYKVTDEFKIFNGIRYSMVTIEDYCKKNNLKVKDLLKDLTISDNKKSII